MNSLTRKDLESLMALGKGPCISLFVPLHRKGPETRQDPILFKDLVREVEERLHALDIPAPEVKKLLEPAESILPYIHDQHQRSDGLAMFRSEELFCYFFLPLIFTQSVTVAHRFHVRPLLPLFSGDGRYYVLALSQNQVRLLQGSRFSIGEIDLGDLPGSLAETLRDDSSWKGLSMRANQSGAEGTSKSVVYGEKKDFKKDILRYFRRIDRGLSDMLKDEHAPLILAGVEYLHPLYREVNTHPHLADGGIAGNPEHLSVEELHAKAWAILGPFFQEARQDAIARYRQNIDTTRTSHNLQEIVPAAYRGRIELMFVDTESRQWGTFDPATGEVHLHQEETPADEDLLEFATVCTILKRGIVYMIEPGEMKEKTPVAAVFRYP